MCKHRANSKIENSDCQKYFSRSNQSSVIYLGGCTSQLINSDDIGQGCILGKAYELIEQRGDHVFQCRMIRMVFQNPDHQLFMPDCLSEILFPLKHKDGQESREWVERSSNLSDHLGLTGMENRHPHSMSLKEKKRLATHPPFFIDRFSSCLMSLPQ